MEVQNPCYEQHSSLQLESQSNCYNAHTPSKSDSKGYTIVESLVVPHLSQHPQRKQLHKPKIAKHTSEHMLDSVYIKNLRGTRPDRITSIQSYRQHYHNTYAKLSFQQHLQETSFQNSHFLDRISIAHQHMSVGR